MKDDDEAQRVHAHRLRIWPDFVAAIRTVVPDIELDMMNLTGEQFIYFEGYALGRLYAPDNSSTG